MKERMSVRVGNLPVGYLEYRDEWPVLTHLVPPVVGCEVLISERKRRRERRGRVMRE